MLLVPHILQMLCTHCNNSHVLDFGLESKGRCYGTPKTFSQTLYLSGGVLDFRVQDIVPTQSYGCLAQNTVYIQHSLYAEYFTP